MRPRNATRPRRRVRTREDQFMNGRSVQLQSALTLALLAMGIGAALAVEEEAKPLPSSGLPAGLDWSFNFDAIWGMFGFNNSFYMNPKPEEPAGDLSDNWMEGSIKPALSAEYSMSSGAHIYAKV